MPKKINLKGVIVSNDDKWIYDWFEIDAVCPKDVIAQIEEASGEDLEVEINSPGGDVFAGSEIYTILKDYKGNVTTKIVGIAASAASVAAMSGKVLISPTAQIMIHNVSAGVRGDYRDMEHAAEFLKNWNVSIANAYLLKTGMTHEELLDLMNKETWLNAQQAVEHGFADEVMFDEESKLMASHSATATLPVEVINKMRNYLKRQLKNEPEPTPEPKPQPEPEPTPDPKNEQTDTGLLSLYQSQIKVNQNRRV